MGSTSRLHDLRHLHASIAIQSGMDAKVLADRLQRFAQSLIAKVIASMTEPTENVLQGDGF